MLLLLIAGCTWVSDDDYKGRLEAVPCEIWLPDVDNDGFGDPNSGEEVCDGEEVPEGYIPNATLNDCSDGSFAINPAATETCNGLDDNCDGTIDEDDAENAATWYADVDGDGFGAGAEIGVSCFIIDGTADNADDCDDAESRLNPYATEICDGLDNNCDGLADASDALGATWQYRDADGDGYGDPAEGILYCPGVDGYVTNNLDENDQDPEAP